MRSTDRTEGVWNSEEVRFLLLRRVEESVSAMTAGQRGQRDSELGHEREVNKHYLHSQSGGAGWKNRVARSTDFSTWTTGRPSQRAQRLSPIVGKVSLRLDDDGSPGEFYVGLQHATFEGATVVSFAAPRAALFYRGRAADHGLAGHVVTRRTFETDDTDLVDFVDHRDDEIDLDQTVGYSTSIIEPSIRRSAPRRPGRRAPSETRLTGQAATVRAPLVLARSVQRRRTRLLERSRRR
jgi:hypothetical protein